MTKLFIDPLICDRLARLQQKVEQAALKANRKPNSIDLLAVSKFQSLEKIEAAIEAGQRLFGENYIQEALQKIAYFKEKQPDKALTWHLIGPIQSNKTALVAAHFDWVQTLDRLKIAQRLNTQRSAELPRLNVLIQINLSQEATKSGIFAQELPEFTDRILELERLQLRGLMIIPKATQVVHEQQTIFKQAYALFTQLQTHCLSVPSQHLAQIDTLSMGMSEDFAEAIYAGSTMIRLGSALFGQRQQAN